MCHIRSHILCPWAGAILPMVPNSTTRKAPGAPALCKAIMMQRGALLLLWIAVHPLRELQIRRRLPDCLCNDGVWEELCRKRGSLIRENRYRNFYVNGRVKFHYQIAWAIVNFWRQFILSSRHILNRNHRRQWRQKTKTKTGTLKLFLSNASIGGECVNEKNARDPIYDKKNSEVLNFT